ncbi:VIT domain-containing protein [Acanthopleuribacter pedis]|uniref:Carboxypeptidase regulatory-like domain-containing protein n=1 Tax=Acanthopleuribacter pedis TaxID=442870 RepID=A0A8J7QDJ3_9BACT|nr:VIT domain-containing protein [Acanthopleuribacter pedis]MBO1321799.1 carboxypeptidase regulatory-like domain-containing protein [Acanthopleuribacter pedis]
MWMRFFTFLTVCSFPLTAQMQGVFTGGGPRLVGQHQGEPAPVTLVDVAIEAKVSGLLAETSLTCTFLNETAEEMEGEFLLPLPAGATISGYALDIDGAMVEGVVVPKDKARFVFEREQRRQVDPGTAEWVDGKVFRTRVFPLPPFQTRTIRIAYVHPLFAFENRLHYRLPLSGYGELRRLDVKVSLTDLPGRPSLVRDPLGSLQVKPNGEGFIVEGGFKDHRPKGELVVACPFPDRDLVDITRLGEADYAFVAAVRAEQTAVKRKTGQWRRLALYWDGSASLTAAGRARATAFLKEFLATYRRVKQVDVVVFRDTQEQPRSFKRRRGAFDELFAFLGEVVADGGTNLYDLQPISGVDIAMLVSDGRDVINSPAEPLFDVPLFAVQPEVYGTDQVLAAWARFSGGDYVALSNTKTAAAVAQVGRQIPALTPIYPAGSRVSEVAEWDQQTLADRLWVCGRFNGAAPLTLSLGLGVDGKQTRNVNLELNPAAATSPLAGRFWAQRHMRDLLVQPNKNREALMALAQRFKLVTPYTTLMVLETYEQYRQYRVPPPEGLAAWRARYFEEVAGTEAAVETLAEYRASFAEEVVDLAASLIDGAWDDENFSAESRDELRAENQEDWADEISEIFVSHEATPVVHDRDNQPVPQPSREVTPPITMKRGEHALVQGVLRSEQEQPLAGIRVFLEGEDMAGREKRFSTQTDRDGHFRFEAFPEGIYSVKTISDGHDDFRSQRFAILGKRHVRLNQRLPRRQSAWVQIPEDAVGPVRGRVVDARGEVLPGFLMSVKKEGQPEEDWPKMAADASGWFSFDALVPDHYRVFTKEVSWDVYDVQWAKDEAGKPYLKVFTVTSPLIEHVFYEERVTVTSAVGGAEAEGGGDPVSVQPWDASVSYIQELSALDQKARYAGYLALKEKHGQSPAFFLDVARLFFKNGQSEMGRRILTNLLEMGIEDAATTRCAAFVLNEFHQWDAAERLYTALADQRPEWPQVRREHGLLLAEAARRAFGEANRDEALTLYQRALNLLGAVLWQPWGSLPVYLAEDYIEDEQFGAFHQVAGVDYQNVYQEVVRRFGETRAREVAYPHLKNGLVKRLEGDLMVTIDWDDPHADMDLWVVEPTGEPCFFKNTETDLGGLLSEDLTAGMGPEAYFLHRAMPGDYEVRVHYFGSDRLAVAGPTTCIATIITNFGRGDEQRRQHVIRLDRADEGRLVATVTIKE